VYRPSLLLYARTSVLSSQIKNGDPAYGADLRPSSPSMRSFPLPTNSFLPPSCLTPTPPQNFLLQMSGWLFHTRTPRHPLNVFRSVWITLFFPPFGFPPLPPLAGHDTPFLTPALPPFSILKPSPFRLPNVFHPDKFSVPQIALAPSLLFVNCSSLPRHLFRFRLSSSSFMIHMHLPSQPADDHLFTL